jgi:hypothetical protein
MAARCPDTPRRARGGRTLLALLGAAGLLLAGCGGSGKPSKAQYLAKANKECAALTAALNAIGNKQVTFQEALVESIKAKEEANKRLHAIKLPADSAVPGQWLHYRDLAMTVGRELPETRPNSARRRTLGAQFEVATRRAVRAARSYGLTACVGNAAS